VRAFARKCVCACSAGSARTPWTDVGGEEFWTRRVGVLATGGLGGWKGGAPKLGYWVKTRPREPPDVGQPRETVRSVAGARGPAGRSVNAPRRQRPPSPGLRPSRGPRQKCATAARQTGDRSNRRHAVWTGRGLRFHDTADGETPAFSGPTQTRETIIKKKKNYVIIITITIKVHVGGTEPIRWDLRVSI